MKVKFRVRFSILQIINLLICLLVISGGISFLKIGSKGLFIDRSGGNIFFYELILIILICLLIVFLVQKTRIRYSKRSIKIFLLILLINLPILIIHLLFSENLLFAYFGNGQLRLLLLLLIFFILLMNFPYKEINLNYIYFSIILIGVVNCIYAIFSQLGIVEQLYFFTSRISFLERQSGLLNAPVSLGIISVLSLLITIVHVREKVIKILLLSILLVGIVLAMSYTSYIILIVGICMLYGKKIFKSPVITLLFLAVAVIGVVIIFFDIIQSNEIRLDSIVQTFSIWYSTYGIGIPWGEVNNYVLDSQGIIPHNWIISSLLYGGTISGVATVLFYFKSVKAYLLLKINSLQSKLLNVTLLLCLLIAALFEQTYILVPLVFLQYIFIVLVFNENC